MYYAYVIESLVDASYHIRGIVLIWKNSCRNTTGE
jgi:hypothetical protein